MQISSDTEFYNESDSTASSWRDKEKRRLSNILNYNLRDHDIDDKGLLSITKLAAYICDCPLSFVTLVGTQNVDFLSRVGSQLTGTCRENSFCNYAIEQDGFFEIEDSLIDNRFTENELVKGQEAPLRYYAGWPIKSPEACNIGSLCVADFKPRNLNEHQIEALKTLGEQVMNQFSK